jgi:hypothetical protein
MRFICKATHNHFIKDKEYTGIELSDGLLGATILFITKDTFGFDKKWYYTKERAKGCDCIKTWFWTLEEWREMRLKELGI